LKKRSGLTPTLALRDFAKQTRESGAKLGDQNRKRFAQYFTPMPVAKQMVGMLGLPATATVNDYGAGSGVLGATVLEYRLKGSTDLEGQQPPLHRLQRLYRLHRHQLWI